MSKYDPKRLKPKKIPITKRTAKRAAALALCVSMVASLITFILPTRAADTTTGLYIREADKNTMDSYVQASLGGYIYQSRGYGGVDGVSSPTVRNNFGSRYAGEVWADLSVFALGQEAIADIRPFEEGESYNEEWLSLAGNGNLSLLGVSVGEPLTAQQANYLNELANGRDVKIDGTTIKGAELTKKTGGDGYFSGDTLNLGSYTDGVNSTVQMMDYSDFLNVFSVLGSSNVVNDQLPTPLDVMFILDTSASMSSTGELYDWNNDNNGGAAGPGDRGRYWTDFKENYTTNDEFTDVTGTYSTGLNRNTRLEYAADALNTAFDMLMNSGSPYNRVGLVTFDVGVQEILPLGRYNTSTVQRTPNQSGGYHNGEDRYFTIAQGGLTYDDRFPQHYCGHGGTNNAGGMADRGGNLSDWNIIEINAKPIDNSGVNRETPVLNIEELTRVQTSAGAVTDQNIQYTTIPHLSTHHDTSSQQGILTGMRVLANADTTVTLYRDSTGRLTDQEIGEAVGELQRRPIVIILSDGAPNVTTFNPVNQNWWNDPEGQTNQMPSAPGVALLSATTAAYWKKMINLNYFGVVDPEEGKTEEELEDVLKTDVYTFGFALADENYYADPSGIADGQLARATLDPASLDTNANEYEGKYPGVSNPYVGSNNVRINDTNQYQTAVQLRDSYIISKQSPISYYNENNVNLGSYTMNHPDNSVVMFTVKNEDGSETQYTAADLDITTVKEFNYPTEYQQVDDPENLPDYFATLIYEMLDTAFMPVEGSNATGLEDMVTYSNPLGDYMTVDGVTDLTMFGEHYRVGRYGVYDYEANEAILGQPDLQNIKSGDLIAEGWYSETENVDGTVTYAYHGTEWNRLTKKDNSFVTSPEEAWVAGYTYRVRYTTAQEFVPTLTKTSDKNGLEPKQEATTYTLYRITGQYARDINWNINKNVVTPITEPANEDDTVNRRYNLSYAVSDALTSEVDFDLLDDIHIWVEDTGDFTDTDENNGGFVVDGGYSRALFVNLTNNVLPVQIATVYLFQNSNGSFTPELYSTNLGDPWKSTPLRVYYDVSLDPDYLRYSEGSEGDKSAAVGVAMADISAEYSKNNTGFYIQNADGFYDQVELNENGQYENKNGEVLTRDPKRYTAFYTNYFTNNAYDYPVILHESDQSRGNPAVTFAVSDENQFYRFQKNRVLFLIPGSFGLTDRPAELDLTEYLIGEDPNDFEKLLTALNKARYANNSPYYPYGDCIPVDGGDNVYLEDIKNYYTERAGGNITGDPRWKTFTDALRAEQELADDVEPVYQPQINSKNWYYIVREFYYPTFDEDEGTATKVEVRYMAIARQGAEFGTGISRSMGEMIEWYNPKESVDNTKEFDSDLPHYGYPDEEKAGAIKPDGSHDHTGDWYVSARPGGLRVGAMSNFVGTKGYVIREGVSETGFVKTNGVIASANVTERADTYYLPGVSRYTDDDTNTDDAAMVVYLGNNGRILVDQTLLLVTKLVQDEFGNPVLDDGTEFTFDVYIQGFAAGIDTVVSRGAVKVKWDASAGKWRRTIGSISALTDNAGLLYGGEYSNVLATITGGSAYGTEEGVIYYIYIPGDYPNTIGSTPVYGYNGDEDEVTKGVRNDTTTTEGEAIVEFLIEAYLIPATDATIEEIEEGTWRFNAGADGVIHIEAKEGKDAVEDGDGNVTQEAEPATGFVIATMDPNVSEDNADITLNSQFRINADYLTEYVDFKYETYRMIGGGESLTMAHARITLKSGEGLLFNTINNDARFEVVESLVADDGSFNWVDEGYHFFSANGVEQVSPGVYTYYDGRYTYTFDSANYTYTVSGRVSENGEYEAVARYINIQELTGLTIRKTVEAEEGATVDEETDYEREFEFTITLRSPVGAPNDPSDRDDPSYGGAYLVGPFDYTIHGPMEGGDGKVTIEKIQEGHLIVAGENYGDKHDDTGIDPEILKDLKAEEAGTWTVTLKHGQYINITGLPEWASYTVKEEPAAGYEPEPVKLPEDEEELADYYGPFNPEVVDGEEVEVDPYEQFGVIPESKTVTDEGTGETTKIAASVNVEFVNVKQPPDPVTIDLLATKTVTGENAPELEEGQYEFTITPAEGNPEDDPIPETTVRNEAPDPAGLTSALVKLISGAKYEKAGKYIYYVKEVQPNPTAPGITYDTDTRIVTVEIKEGEDANGDYTGKLTATVTVAKLVDGEEVALEVELQDVPGTPAPEEGDYLVFVIVDNGDNDGDFVNTYNPMSITITLEGVKIFENGTLTGGMFDFELTGIADEETGLLPPVPDGFGGGWQYILGNGLAIKSGESEDEEFEYEEPEDGESKDEEPEDEEPENEEPEDEEPENEEPKDEEPENEEPEDEESGDVNPDGDDKNDGNDKTSEPDTTHTAVDSVVLYADKIMLLVDEEPEEENSVPNSVRIKNNGIGEIIAKITFTDQGIYVYEIRELIPEDNGSIVYDQRVYTVRVEVNWNADGTDLYAAWTITLNDEEVDEIEFVNIDTAGNLTVTKTVTGTAGDAEKDFHFRVELSDDSINGDYGEMTFEDGVAEFTLKHGESKTATGLPEGITYTVTENEADQDGYTTSSTGSSGEIVAGETVTAEFINNKDPDDDDDGNLVVRKTVTGSEGDRDKEFTFTITLSSRITGTYGGITFVNGVATVKLKHGESVRATGLPAGITYTVTEAEADQDGYTTSSTGSRGRIPANGTARAEFVNDKDSPPEETTPPPSETPPPEETTPPPSETLPPEETTPPPEETTPPPSETLPPDIPKTGDESQLGLWLILLGLSAAGLFVSLFYTVRKIKPKDKDQK